MTEEQNSEQDFVELDIETDTDELEEYEEISGEEVDRVVEELEKLIATVQSENIQVYLEEALNEIYSLVHDDEDEEEEFDVISDSAEAA